MKLYDLLMANDCWEYNTKITITIESDLTIIDGMNCLKIVESEWMGKSLMDYEVVKFGNDYVVLK